MAIDPRDIFPDNEAYAPGDDYDPSAMLPPLTQPIESLGVEMGGAPEGGGLLGLSDEEIESMFGESEFAGADWASDDALYHDANLAQFIEQTQCDKLAQNVITWVQRDRESRKPWERREADGIRKLGLTPADLANLKATDPLDWRSTATHPGLMKAGIQFWARAFTELWPAGGPAKAIVMGATSPDREAQARRVSGFLNYLYTQEMPGATNEASQALFRLPFSGSIFRKAFFDPILGTLAVRFLESQDFVKPYSASDLGSAPRYTHIVRLSRNDLNRSIALGYYLDVPKSEATASFDRQLLDTVIDEATGQSPSQGSGEHEPEQDSPDVLYETSVTLDLADYDWEDPLGESLTDSNGQRRSIGVPYLVTVHVEAQRVLSIRRDWRETDQKKRRRRNVIEYKFLPGFGGYGFGLLHIAAGLSDAQTGFLRYLLDGCTLHTLGTTSGYVSQSAVGLKGLKSLKIGEFQTVPLGAAELDKAFWTPKFAWQSNNTLQTLEYLDRLLDFLVAATEAVVGEDNGNIPVGTMLARREERTLPFRSIFVALHSSLGEELRAVADLAADYLPPCYPYAQENADCEIFAADFDERVDVLPVSDPNIVSASQRMAQAQFVFEQAQILFKFQPSPETWESLIVSYQHMLDMMRVPTPERFVPRLPAPQPMQPAGPDPVQQAEIQRKDAAALADIQRKNAIAQADVQRKAQQMQVDSALREQGNKAIQTQEQTQELSQTERDIIDMAQARKLAMQQQINQQAGLP